jgi:hypothetical protein
MSRPQTHSLGSSRPHPLGHVVQRLIPTHAAPGVRAAIIANLGVQQSPRVAKDLVGASAAHAKALLVIASGLYRLMARQMRGYNDAQARQIFRDLIDMSADVAITDRDVTVRFHRRAHLPIVLDSDLFKKTTPVPWWNGLPLRFVE